MATRGGALDDPRERELAALRRENDALSRAIVLLHRISNLVRSAEELEPTCYALLTGVTAGVGLGMNRAAIFLREPDGALRGAAGVGPMDREEADRVWRAIEREAPDLETLYEAGLEAAEGERGLFDRAVRAARVDPRGESPLALAMTRAELVHGEGDDDLGGLLDLPTALAAPLRGRRGVRGVLVADRRFTEKPADAATRLVFDMLADQAGRAVENAERFERLAREARTDALTGLGSRRSFDEELRARVAEALASGGSVGLLLLDLDDFKRLNDTQGHPAGDAVLAEVGARLASALRPGEAFRYGGEELAVLLAGVGAAGLPLAAERVHAAITASPIALPSGASVQVGVSIGAASLPSSSADAAALVRAADDALLASKAAGKNRVSVAPRESGA